MRDFSEVLLKILLMKILHTSDWHLGQQLYGYDRTDEYLHFFNRLKEIIRWERPDAFLLSGDIFDVSNPSSTIMRIFKDNILELQRLFPDMSIIVTAGNHDSASRIDIDRNLWSKAGIKVIGVVDRMNGEFDFGNIIVKVGDKGIIVALPYLNRFMLSSGQKDSSDGNNIFFKISEFVREINSENLPVVLMAHLSVSDCDTEGHRQIPIGGMDAIDKKEFGESFDYIALGHIHKPQKLNEGRIAYCGSPLAVSFDENYPHSISMVTVERGKLPETEEIKIEPLRALKTIPEEGVPFAKAIKLLKKLPDDEMSYIRLNVRQEESLPSDCIEQAVAKVKGKSCRFCTFRYVQELSDDQRESLPQLHVNELKEMVPVEIVESYFRTMGMNEENIQKNLSLIRSLEEELELEDRKN